MLPRTASAQEHYEGMDGIPYRRFWPIDSPPRDEFEVTAEPSINPGDLVVWGDDTESSLFRGLDRKRIGIVLMSRWVLADWIYVENQAPKIMPECLVLWDDGEKTNTSHVCLRIAE
jgi:hypothetical protein